MKKLLLNQKGFSLVEILVSITILGMMAIFILPSLTFGYVQLFEAGKQTEAYANVQSEMEEELAKTDTPTSSAITIEFGSQTISVNGAIVEKEEDYGTRGHKAKVKVFIPGR